MAEANDGTNPHNEAGNGWKGPRLQRRLACCCAANCCCSMATLSWCSVVVVLAVPSTGVGTKAKASPGTLLGGQVSFRFWPTSCMPPWAKSGRPRALSVRVGSGARSGSPAVLPAVCRSAFCSKAAGGEVSSMSARGGSLRSQTAGGAGDGEQSCSCRLRGSCGWLQGSCWGWLGQCK